LLTPDQEDFGLQDLLDPALLTRTFKIRTSGRMARISVLQAHSSRNAQSMLANALAESWTIHRARQEDILE
jgi:hypothetical protein